MHCAISNVRVVQLLRKRFMLSLIRSFIFFGPHNMIKKLWKKIYLGSSIHWFIILGNHDKQVKFSLKFGNCAMTGARTLRKWDHSEHFWCHGWLNSSWCYHYNIVVYVAYICTILVLKCFVHFAFLHFYLTAVCFNVGLLKKVNISFSQI